jgi:hypothetical protein
MSSGGHEGPVVRSPRARRLARGTALRALATLAVAMGMTAWRVPSATVAGQAGVARLPASAGSVRGRVEVRPAGPAARRPLVAALGAPDHLPAPVPSPAVVYLEPAPPEPTPPPAPRRAMMDQRDETFVPHVLAITTGSVVDFPNSDRIYHNVFSLSKVRRFDLGRYAAGRSESVRFDRPGIVRVFCDIHSHMNAFILVFDHRFFATTGEDGRYRIDRVPPGRYSLVAWHEGETSAPKQVTVPPNGTAEIDFELR